MAARIIQPTEAINVESLCCLVYGQPGARKTSLCQTAENVITLAFDEGVYRAHGRKAAVLFDTWADVLEFDLSQYKTIVVDTIGMCLAKLGQAIIADNPKNGNRLGGLSLPGYGVLKVQFESWVQRLRARRQTIVFTAHERAEKQGEGTYYCPDIVGSNYNTVMNVADIVGYLHFESGKRCLNFNPTDQWMAKCPPCGWGTLHLPDFKEQPDFLARLLEEARKSMGRISEDSALASRQIAEWAEWLQLEPPVEALNARLPRLAELCPAARKQVWVLIQDHAQGKLWEFDKPTKKFLDLTTLTAPTDEDEVAEEEVLA